MNITELLNSGHQTVLKEFEQEYRLDAREVGEFLIELGEQLRDGDELTITTDEWELPFAFGEPVELDVEFGGDGSLPHGIDPSHLTASG